MPSTGVYGFQIWSNALVNYKSKILGLPLGKKLDFGIPLEIFQNPDLSRSFIRGYFDTDGCLYIENKRGKPYSRLQMATISPKFARQLKTILLKLGFHVSLHKDCRIKYGWNDLYKIFINGDKMTWKWFEEIKPKNPKFIKKLKNGSAEI